MGHVPAAVRSTCAGTVALGIPQVRPFLPDTHLKQVCTVSHKPLSGFSIPRQPGCPAVLCWGGVGCVGPGTCSPAQSPECYIGGLLVSGWSLGRAAPSATEKWPWSHPCTAGTRQCSSVCGGGVSASRTLPWKLWTVAQGRFSGLNLLLLILSLNGDVYSRGWLKTTVKLTPSPGSFS